MIFRDTWLIFIYLFKLWHHIVYEQLYIFNIKQRRCFFNYIFLILKIIIAFFFQFLSSFSIMKIMSQIGKFLFYYSLEMRFKTFLADMYLLNSGKMIWLLRWGLENFKEKLFLKLKYNQKKLKLKLKGHIHNKHLLKYYFNYRLRFENVPITKGLTVGSQSHG